MTYYNYAINDEPYSFLYIDAQENPATFYLRFETVIGRGDKSEIPKKSSDDSEEPFEKND